MIRIVSSGYNCEKYVAKCIESVMKQTVTDWKLYVIDDGSTDRTRFEIMEHNKDPRIASFSYGQNKGAAYRRWQVITTFNPGDIVLLLGLDDELLPNCLEEVMKQYDKGKWMTYGNWINQHGKGLPVDFALDFDDKTHAERSYRTVTYRSTAPNTFYAKLFHAIPAEDFMIDGKWIDSTTESEVMFSCLEMCGRERIGIIKKPIYLYNEGLKGGTLNRLGREYKYKLLEVIKNRPKRNLYEQLGTKDEQPNEAQGI